MARTNANGFAGSICVIGAGSAGLAALKTFSERGFSVVGFEGGSGVGGNWRYENDSGTSAAYRSLRCNVSRRRMEYPSFPMPRSYPDFPSHAQMLAYLESYADHFDLLRRIRFRSPVAAVERAAGGWKVTLASGESSIHAAVLVANGHHWSPHRPQLAGSFDGTMLHSHEYRQPEPFAGKRVLVVGGGQSAIEIATELTMVARATLLSLRSGTHVLPRYVLGRPVDFLDLDWPNRLPWRFLDALLRGLLRLSGFEDPADHGWPSAEHRLLEHVPSVSSDLASLLARRAIEIRPRIEALDGGGVRFGDGSRANVDAIILATGYEIRFPFLSSDLIAVRGRSLPLYRRIVPPHAPGLCFIGLVDAPSGLLPIVERQSEWLAALLGGRITLPEPDEMRAAIDRAETRTRERFPGEAPYSIRCDPHAYARLLKRDLRRRPQSHPARHRQGIPSSSHILANRRRRTPSTTVS